MTATTFTVKQVAERWNCSPKVVLAHIRAGSLAAFDVASGTVRSNFRVRLEAIENFERAREAKQETPAPTRGRWKRRAAGVIEPTFT